MLAPAPVGVDGPLQHVASWVLSFAPCTGHVPRAQGALAVSEYTDKIDILTWRSKTGRMNAEIKSICALLCGLVVAEDFTEGQKLIRDRDFVANASFFRSCFEVGRRYKASCLPRELRSSILPAGNERTPLSHRRAARSAP